MRSFLQAVQACSYLFCFLIYLSLSDEVGGDGEDEGGKEGSEGERQITSIQTRSPTNVFEEELASAL